MFFLFCSKTDSEAIWLYNQVGRSNDIDAEILFVEDLQDCRDWHLRINNETSFAEVKLPGGRKINTQNVTLFLNRVSKINNSFSNKDDLAETQYFQREWNAFLLSWLKAFESVLVNRVSPTSFSGFASTSLHWSLMAHKAGFVVKPQSYLSDSVHIQSLLVPNISKRAQSVLVYNKKVYCNIDLAKLAAKCLSLAAACHCKLLEIFVEKKISGEYKFITANSLTAFRIYSQSFIQAFRLSVMKAQKMPPEKNYRNKLVEAL